MINSQRTLITTLFLTALFCWSSILQAAEWFADPSFRLKGEYNDNLTMTSLPHDEVWGIWTSPGIQFGGRTERIEISGSALADFVRYEGNQPVEFTNLFFPLSVQYTGETNRLGLNGSIVRDNTLLGELQETGIVNIFRQRNRRIVNPTWEHYLTERLYTRLGYQFTDVDYEEPINQLFPYQVHAGNTGLGYLLTERTSVEGTLSYGNFHVSDQGFRSIYYGLQLQGTHSITETLEVSALGGIRRVENSVSFLGLTQKERSTVWISSGTVKQQYEVMSLEGSISRELSPSGLGLLVQTDKVQAKITGQLLDTLQANLSGSYFWVTSAKSPNTIQPFLDRNFWTVKTGLKWQFHEWWYLEGAYRHRERKIENSSIESTGNMFTLTLTFKGWTWATGH